MKKRMGKSIFLKKVTVSVLAMAVLVSSVTGCGKKESSADVKSVNQIKEIDKDHFFKEEEIKDYKYYSIVSTGFCFPIDNNSVGGDDFREVYKWFRPRNPEYIHIGKDNLTRDILINFLRNIDELIGSKYYNQKEQRMRILE